VIRAITWNLFHGRDHPPDPGLSTWRSRLTRQPEWNATHQQVNRELLEEFRSVLAHAEWDVALLQECPPRYAEPLARATNAEVHRVLTSRNWLLPVTQWAARLNPDLIASWEGGSNATLVRGDRIVGREALVVRRRPERRVIALTRLASGLCIANLHASGGRNLAEEDVRRAASAALEFAEDRPLIFGGDLNLRPASSALFADLAAEGFGAPTGPDAIDHLLNRGGEIVEPPRAWPPGRREIPAGDLAIRLSDHAPVEAVFEFAAA
jgi:endonuclease/exonuclease/phosphatase family metal-dependent hydrolase